MSENNKIPARVAITYSVDFHEVPTRVQLMLHELSQKVEDISRLAQACGTACVAEPTQALAEMAHLQAVIAKASLRVEDCMEIMAAYLKLARSLQKDTVPQKEE